MFANSDFIREKSVCVAALLVFAKNYQKFFPLRSKKRTSENLLKCSFAVCSAYRAVSRARKWEISEVFFFGLGTFEWLTQLKTDSMKNTSSNSSSVNKSNAHTRHTKRIYKQSLELHSDDFSISDLDLTMISTRDTVSSTWLRNKRHWKSSNYFTSLWVSPAENITYEIPHRHFSFKSNFIGFSRSRTRDDCLWSTLQHLISIR